MRFKPHAVFLVGLALLALQGPLASAQEENAQAGNAQEESTADEKSEEGSAETPILAEINVTASYSINRDEPISSLALSREEILQMPHFGDDLYRALAVMPGVSGNDISAQFNVRGGLYRDTALRIDGIEIYEPYHLKDFQGVFSIIDPDMIGAVDLIPGGFPAEYGDKMAGVLDMGTLRPDAGRSVNLGVSIASAWASGSGSYGDNDQGRWLISGRRGYLDLLLNVAGEEEEGEEGNGPAYWDLIAKIDHPISTSQTLSFNVLTSDDTLDQRESEEDEFGFPESETVDSNYSNSYAWLTHQWLLGSKVFADTVVSTGRVERDRYSAEESFAKAFEIHDIRTMDVLTVQQNWNAQPSDRHYLKWGFEARSYDVDYDYTNDLALEGPLGTNGLTRFVDSFSGEHYAAYVADRIQLTPAFVAEIGARYDQQTLTDEDQFSPRLNLIYDLGKGGVLRGAWGHYYQSQRPHELQVEDGETRFFEADKAETFQIGWERSFGLTNLRLEAYQRTVDDPRPYYTNLFEAFDPNPEATRDRVMIDAESSDAHGIEVFLGRRGGKRWSWWASYTWSEVTDRLNGRDVPRSYDQTHAVTVDVNYRIGRKWNLNAAWNYHSGWPTTEIAGQAVIGADGLPTIEPVLGPINGENLDDYHRLDVRASRVVELKNGKSFEVFIDVQNLYNRENAAGFSLDERNFMLLPSGEVEYIPSEETWLGALPSFGFSWRF